MKTVPLRRVAKILNGGTPTTDVSNWGGAVPWATPVDLARVDGLTIEQTDRTLSLDGLANGSTLAPAGAVIVSTRAPIGYTACATVPMAFNQGCKAVVGGPALHPRFAQYALISMTSNLKAAGSGSTFLELSSDSLASQRLPLPSVDEQRRIAAFLDDRVGRLDRVIAARREQIHRLAETYTAWLDGLVGRFAAVPMRRFLEGVEQGWSPVADSIPATSAEPGVLKLGAVRAGVFDPTANKAFLPGTDPREEYRIREGDLLVTRANTPALVGDVAVVGGVGERRLYLSDLIYRVKLSDYDPHLASAALRTPRVRQLLGVLARGTSGSMPKLRGEDLAELPLPNVPRAEQESIGALDVAERQGRDRKVASLVRSVSLLTEYKTSIITSAVAGDIDMRTFDGRIPA